MLVLVPMRVRVWKPPETSTAIGSGATRGDRGEGHSALIRRAAADGNGNAVQDELPPTQMPRLH